MKALLFNTNIKFRYILTIITSLIVAGVNFYIQILISKILPVSVYGEYLFLLGIFLVFLPFLEMGTSQAFFTFISQKTHSKKFYLYYLAWLLFQFFITIIIIYIIYIFGFQGHIFFTENKILVYLIFIFTFLSVRLLTILKYIYESNKLSNISQLFVVLISVSNLIFIFGISLIDTLDIEKILFISISVLIFYHVISIVYINRNSIIQYSDEEETFKSIFNKFYIYSLPLLFASAIGFANGYFENWFIMHYGGSEERAYFGIAERISAIILIFTGAIVNIFWKEISLAHKSDKIYMEKTINNVQNLFFIFTVSFVVLTLFYSESLLYYSFGDKYMYALFSLKLFFISTIFTSQGQLLSIVIVATSLTKLSLYFAIFGAGLRILFMYTLLYLFIEVNISELVIVSRLIVLILSLIITEFIIYKSLKLNYKVVFNKYIISIIVICFLSLVYYGLFFLGFNTWKLFLIHISISILFLLYIALKIYKERIVFGIRILS